MVSVHGVKIASNKLMNGLGGETVKNSSPLCEPMEGNIEIKSFSVTDDGNRNTHGSTISIMQSSVVKILMGQAIKYMEDEAFDASLVKPTSNSYGIRIKQAV